MSYVAIAAGRGELRLPSFICLCLSRLSGRLRLGLQDVGHAAIATGRRELWLRSITAQTFRSSLEVCLSMN